MKPNHYALIALFIALAFMVIGDLSSISSMWSAGFILWVTFLILHLTLLVVHK